MIQSACSSQVRMWQQYDTKFPVESSCEHMTYGPAATSDWKLASSITNVTHYSYCLVCQLLH